MVDRTLVALALVLGCADIGEETVNLSSSWVCGWTEYRRVSADYPADTCWTLRDHVEVLMTSGEVMDPCDVERSRREVFRGDETIVIWRNAHTESITPLPNITIEQVACE